MIADKMDLSLLPYRCPRCGKNAYFTTLGSLRHHLAVKHSYSGRSTSRRKASGRKSPLTESFILERELLEQQLRDVQVAEAKHHLKTDPGYIQAATWVSARLSSNRLHKGLGSPQWTPSPVKADHQVKISADTRNDPLSQYYDPDGHDDGIRGFPNFSLSCVNASIGQSTRPLLSTARGHSSTFNSADEVRSNAKKLSAKDNGCPGGLLEPDVSIPLSIHDLQRNKTLEGEPPWSKALLSEALTHARDHVDALKKTADDVVLRQGQLIHLLRTELKEKDGHYENVTGQLGILRSERRELVGKVSQLNRDNDQQANVMAVLNEEVREKDGLIREKEIEAHDTTALLNEASLQEFEGKAQLEPDITGLARCNAQCAKRAVQVLHGLGVNETSRILPPVMQPTGNMESFLSMKNSPTYTSRIQKRGTKEKLPKVNLSRDSVLSHYATAHLTPLITATPPLNPPNLRHTCRTVPSPFETQSSSTAHSQGTTRGYFSINTPVTSSSTPLLEPNKCKAVKGNGTPTSPVPYNLSFVKSLSYESPLSPGELVVEHLNWPSKGLGVKVGRSLQEEGVEPMMSDSQGSVSGQSSPSTLLPYLTSSFTQELSTSTNGTFVTAPAYSRSNSGKDALLKLGVNERRDVLYTVFSYLDTMTLCRMSLVCCEWRAVSRDPVLWRRVCLMGTAPSSKFLSTLSQWCTQLHSLTLKGLSGRTRKTREDRETYRRRVRGSLEPGLESLLYAGRETLHSLSIVDCSNILTERSLWLASCHCRHLERVAYISELDPVGSEAIWALGAGCRHIQTLIIPPKYPNAHPSRFTNRCLKKVAACWPQLAVLCIGGREVTVRGVTELAKICTGLQVLELDHMCEVTEEDMVVICQQGLRSLSMLEFSFTPVTPRALLHLVSTLPNLRCVKIRLCIGDYFHDVEDPEHQHQYRDIMSKLELVQRRPGMSEVIHITDHSLDVG